MRNRAGPVDVEFTAEFELNLRLLAKKYRHIRSDVEPVLLDLGAGKSPGDGIRGLGQVLYKVRVQNSDIQKGKSSGYRVIYWVKSPALIILVTIYSKTEQSDVSPSVLRRIMGQVED